MKPKNFKKLMEELVFADIFTDINRFMKVSKTNFLSTSLQLKLGTKVILIEDTTIEPVSNQLQLLDDSFSSELLANDEANEVVFYFSYKDKKHLDRLLKAAAKYPFYFAFQYLKHIFLTVSKLNTDAQTVIAMRHFSGKKNAFDAITLSNTIYASETVMNMIKKVDSNAYRILCNVYKPSWEDKSINDIYEFVADMLDDIDITRISKSAKKINIREHHINITSNSNIYYNHELDTSVSSHGKVDIYVANLAQSILNTISSNCRGTYIGELFNNAFDSIKTDVSWFKKIKKRFIRDVKEKTDDSYASWQGLNNSKRHLYHSPIYKHKNNKINLIVSVDNSGSMSDADLAKVLYLFEKKAKHIAQATILIHDAAVVKVIKLNDSYGNITDHPDWIGAFNRRTNGGTSHGDVFRHINNMKLKDPDQVIYCSFSDNYSDIEEAIFMFPIMQKITKYWVSTTNGKSINTSLVGGTNIQTP